MGSLFLSKSGFLPYCFWNMLLDVFLKPLSSATYVPTITVAHVFINNHTSVMKVGSTSFLVAGSMHWLEKIKRGDTAP